MIRRQLLRSGVACTLAAAGVQARACEFFSSTLRVIHPWTRATADDATWAVVCMGFDQVSEDERLLGIETSIATGAELMLPGAAKGQRLVLDIPQGRETRLTEHGLHIRLTGLLLPLDAGRAYPMRLLFQTAGPLRVDLTVDYGRFT